MSIGVQLYYNFQFKLISKYCSRETLNLNSAEREYGHYQYKNHQSGTTSLEPLTAEMSYTDQFATDPRFSGNLWILVFRSAQTKKIIQKELISHGTDPP